VKRARKRFRDPLVRCTVEVNNAPSTGLRDLALSRPAKLSRPECKQKENHIFDFRKF